MTYHIKELLLEGEAFDKVSILPEATHDRLRQLSKINVFVGANNCGKSRFMRALASMKRYRFTSQFNPTKVANLLQYFISNAEKIITRYGAVDASNILDTARKLNPFDIIEEKIGLLKPFENLLNTSLSPISGLQVHSAYSGHNTEAIHNELVTLASNTRVQLDKISASFPKEYTFRKIYLPTLRGLRPLGQPIDYYGDRTKEDYFKTGASPEITTGLLLYEDIRKLLLGNLEQREIIAAFQSFLSARFFEGRPLALIPKHDSNVLSVKIGEEKEFPIHDLGDGIQSIIILTFPLFRYRDENLLVFMEEPELYMHPGLQRMFLSSLAALDNHQYFLTTHSNHFLDITLDIDCVSIFTVRKELEAGGGKERLATVQVENISSEAKHSLELLGVRNSSVFLSNCTVWVEGITDRHYLRHYLHLYQQHLLTEAQNSLAQAPKLFKEDLHFSFVEYGGGNITHWSFLDVEENPIDVDRLCAKLFLVADRNNDISEGNIERHQKLRAKLGDGRYYRLQCREIENLLAPKVIRAIVTDYEGDANVELHDFVQDDYKDDYLGSFIEKKVLKQAKKRKGSYASESGTVSAKADFCQKAISNLRSFAELSTEAQQLTAKLHTFIAQNNS